MNKSPKFSIIIVTYQSERFIGACLKAIQSQSSNDFEVIIVDNASQDGTLNSISASDTVASRLIANDQNLGFAAACNQGVNVAKGKWSILLNPDTVVRQNWLEEIESGIARHPTACMFASTQLRLDDETVIDGAGDVYSTFGIPWRGAEGRTIDDLPDEGEVFGPCGAAAVYATATYLDVGGLDERLFCYCEDVDLALRFRLAGHHAVFLPKAIVAHKGGGSSDDDDQSFAISYGFRNRLLVFVKNMPSRHLIYAVPIHVLITLGQAFSARRSKKGYSSLILKALWQGLRKLPYFLSARDKVHNAAFKRHVRPMMAQHLEAMRVQAPFVRPI